MTSLYYLTDAEIQKLSPDHLLEYNAVPPGWEAFELKRNGEVVAVLVHRGTEVHLNVRPGFEKRVLSRKAFMEMLEPLRAKLGFLTTKLPLESVHERQFVERIGFTKTWSSNEFDYFMLTTEPFARKP